MLSFRRFMRRTMRCLQAACLSVAVLLLQCFWSPAVVFVVYGNKGTHRSYAPKWIECIARFIGLMPVLSVITCGKQKGIVIGLYDSIEDIDADLPRVLRIQEQLIRKFPHSVIALAGRLPSLIHRAGGTIQAPVVGGYTGTCYAMRCIALELAERFEALKDQPDSERKTSAGDAAESRSSCCQEDSRSITEADSVSGSSNHASHVHAECDVGRQAGESPQVSAAEPASELLSSTLKAGPAGTLTVSVLGGAGFVGGRLVKDLAHYFHTVIAYDKRYEETETEGNIIRTGDPSLLGNGQVSLIFTPCGDDVAPLIKYMSPGSIVADDTHPCVSALVRKQFRAAQVTLLKAAATNLKEPVSFNPKLPNFYSNSVPGCLLEALVVSAAGQTVTKDFEVFCEKARDLGFGPQLMEDMHEPLIDKEKSRLSFKSQPEAGEENV